MAGSDLHAGLGESVLKEFLKKKKQLSDLEQRIRELSGRLYTPPSVDLEKPLVDHSRVLDRLEQNAVTLQALQEEKDRMLNDQALFLEELAPVKEELAPLFWEILSREYLQSGEPVPLEPEKTENSSAAEDRVRRQALAAFWESYHQKARKDPAEEARQCFYIKRYYDSLVNSHRMQREEADRRMEETAGMSLRGIYRKIRLLYLEREIREWLELGRISETGAYHLSFLKKSQQRLVVSLAEQKRKKIRITPKIALTLRECTFSDWYHVERIREILKSGSK